MKRIYTEIRIHHQSAEEKEQFERQLDDKVKASGFSSRAEYIRVVALKAAVTTPQEGRVEKMKIEKITNPGCSCNFAHGATIKTEGGRFLGATCDPGEAENIIKSYFETEFFPETVHVLFDGIWGYTFRLAE